MNNRRNNIIAILTIGILVLTLFVFLYYFFFLRPYVTTDDAYVNGDRISVSSQIQGRTIAVYVNNGDLVAKGKPVVRLDPTDYQLAYQKSLDQLAQTSRDVRKLQFQVTESSSLLAIRQAELRQSEYNFSNRRDLQSIDAVTNEEVKTNETLVSAAQEQVNIVQSQLNAIKNLLGNRPIEENPQILMAADNVRASYLNLLRCDIVAPITGIVGQRSVEIGEAVDPRRPLFAIVPPDTMWVDANYKEIELTDVRIGQPAEVRADIFGSDVVYKGKVIGIAPGTGAAFSLLPPQNASGNWIKIVQRVPVRISLDPETLAKFPLRLGLSCKVSVKVTDTTGTFNVEKPVLKPHSTTPVYEIDFTELNQQIDKIIRENVNEQHTSA